MPTTLGQNVRRMRLARRYSQMALAEKAGVSQSWISRIEHSQENPTIESLSRIATALGVGVTVLLQDSPSGEQAA